MAVQLDTGFQETIRNLKQQKDARKTLPALQERRAQAAYRLQAVEGCIEVVEREIRRLERSFVASLFGRKEHAIAAKREETEAMRPQLEECTAELESIDAEIRSIEEQLIDPEEVDRKIQQLYREKAAQVQARGDEAMEQLQDLEARLQGARAHRQLVKKGHQVAKDVLERLFSMTRSVGRARTRGIGPGGVGALTATAVNAVLQNQSAKPAVQRVCAGLEELVQLFAELRLDPQDRRNEAIVHVRETLAACAAEVQGKGAGGMMWDAAGSGPMVGAVQETVSLLDDLSDEADQWVQTCEDAWRTFLETA